MKSLPFDHGDRMPILGLGTWKSAPEEVYDAVKEAIRIGYRHIDCAAAYGNEDEVGRALGEAIGEGLVNRDELWITSKLWNDRHQREDVRPALRESLDRLGLEYLDLYLIHWPVAFRKGVGVPSSPDDFLSLDDCPLDETWDAMVDLKEEGLARHVGVSNFSIAKLQGLMESESQRPEVNQIELHPYLQQPEMLDFCAEEDIVVTAYSPLGSGDRPERLKDEDEPVLLEDPVIAEIAEEHEATPAQVLIAWAIHRDTALIPKSVNPGRIEENFASANLSLTDEDMSRIEDLDRHYRYVAGDFLTAEGSPYDSLEDLWDE